MTTATKRPRKRPSALQKRLPRKAARSLAELAENHGLTFEQAAFAALVQAGCSQTAAYKALQPDVTDLSAKTLGSRMAGEIAKRLDGQAVNTSEVMVALADWRVFRALATEKSPDMALRAADMTYRRLGLYGEAQVVLNLAGFTPQQTVEQQPAPLPVVVEVPASPD